LFEVMMDMTAQQWELLDLADDGEQPPAPI
jgi:hypothetical protein